MVQKLVDYVSQLQRSGYSSQAIQASLIRAGYSDSEIYAAFAGKSNKLPLLYILYATLLVFFVLFLVIYFIFFYFPNVDVSLNARLLSSKNVFPGDYFIIEKSITASQAKTPVNVLYELVSSSGTIIYQKSEKLLISGLSKSQSKFIVPQNVNSGVYSIKIVAYFAGNSVNVVLPVYVSELSVAITQSTPVLFQPSFQENTSQNISVGCAQSCLSNDPCVKGSCVSGFCKFDAITPCCGNGKCEPGEDSTSCPADCGIASASQAGVVASAQSVAKSDVSKAILLCDSLIEDAPIDDCLAVVSKESLNILVCNYIHISTNRDDCYMRFALNNNFSGCDKIVDRYMANSCVYLSQAKTASS